MVRVEVGVVEDLEPCRLEGAGDLATGLAISILRSRPVFLATETGPPTFSRIVSSIGVLEASAIFASARRVLT